MTNVKRTSSSEPEDGRHKESHFIEIAPTNIKGEDLVVMPPPGGYHADSSTIKASLLSQQEERHTYSNHEETNYDLIDAETQNRRDQMMKRRSRDVRSAQLHSTFGMGGTTSTVQVLGNDTAKIDELMRQFEKHDEDEGVNMTLSRRIVEKYLLHRKWYNPQYIPPVKSDTEQSIITSSQQNNKDSFTSTIPNLKHAWAYFEHITLPRRFVHAGDGTSKYDRADPGEMKEQTMLYNPWKLPESELSQWGIGMGLYFKTLRYLAFIFLIVGLINIINMLFFMSPKYSPQGQSNLRFIFQGTAICTNRQWVQCLDCTPAQWDAHADAFAIDATNNTFVERNACQNGATIQQGMVNYASMLFLIVALIVTGIFQKRVEQKLDEDILSATDYSICVRNPPSDAYDPDVWRNFFNQFEDDGKEVTFVTIALANSELIYALIRRRRLRKILQMKLGSHINLDNTEQVKDAIRLLVEQESQKQQQQNRCTKCWSKFYDAFKRHTLNKIGLSLSETQLYNKLNQMDTNIKELQEKTYPVAKVFVTFETEAGQRNALAALSTSKVNMWFNRTSYVGETVAFYGKVLEVIEPQEPTSIRWQDLGFPTWKKVLQRFVTTIIIAGVIALDVYILYLTRQNVGPQFAAIMISVFNLLIPLFCHLLNMIEQHSTQGGYQTSLFSKIAVFRWFNTALVVMLITPFTRSLTIGETDLLPQVGIILFYELWFEPLLIYIDPWGFFLKHYWAPRCKSQETMNWCFRGETVTLAERYTDFMKVMLLASFYSPLYPSSFLFAAASFIIQYMMDKFRLVRAWARQPLLGSKLATFVQAYFFSTMMVIVCIATSFLWSGFTFDNVCATDEVSTVNGEQQVTLGTGEIPMISIHDNSAYKFCLQDLFRSDGWNFPPTPNKQPNNSKWMTDEQEIVTRVFGWTSVVVVAVWVLLVFGGTLTKGVMSLVKGTYKNKSRDMQIDFCNVQEVSAYVPQIVFRGMDFPILICDVDDIDSNLIGWNDACNGYDKHNMFFDLPRKDNTMKRIRLVNEEGKQIDVPSEDYIITSNSNSNKKTRKQTFFSTVRHWPPFVDNRKK